MSILDLKWTPPVLTTTGKKPASARSEAKLATFRRAERAEPVDILDNPHWHAARRVWLTHKQHCRACHSVVEYIAADTVEFHGPRGATRRVAYIAAGALSPFLPTEVDFTGLDDTFVDFCPACLRLSARVDDILTDISEPARQGTLWPTRGALSCA